MKPLQEYVKKRNFRKTSEPIAKVAAKKAHSLKFVIQEHHASHLHYDFRLEMHGVLKSWAVPKGPSPDPSEKRLAVEVEDHPLAYGSFEGEIPEDEYGGGEVLLWDTGTWQPEGDAESSFRKGHLDFSLKGKRMKGRWSLIRTRSGSSKPNWLLFKRHDEKQLLDPADFHPIKDYGSKKERKVKTVKNKTAFEKLPGFIEPQLPLLVKDLPQEEGWIHEMKFDGYRIQTHLENNQVKLITRSGQDWTAKYPTIAKAFQKTKLKNALIDGEIVVLGTEGRSDFQSLQMAMKEGKANFLYYVFDLLFLNGVDIREEPLIERKKLLKEVVKSLKAKNVIFSEHLKNEGNRLLTHSCESHEEGVISKREDSPYVSGRTQLWVKSKCEKRQEFVIGGYTDPDGKREVLGALLLGVYEEGKLRYVGKCGTGFNQENLKMIAEKLKKFGTKESPFAIKSPRARGIHWLKPILVAEVTFAQWTQDEQLRQAAFHGLREDKPAKEIKKEDAAPMPRAKQRGSLKEMPTLSHPDKIIFKKEKITKQEIADYYTAISEFILPEIAGRPLSLKRCPEGSEAECFFQKHLKNQEEITAQSLPELISLVQMGAFELHAWGAREPDIEHADQIVMDFDPDAGVSFAEVKKAAWILKATLDKLKLKSFIKVTGGKGLHVHIPIAPIYDWDQIKSFSKVLADEMVARFPEKYLAVMSKSKRKGKIFIDYLRNGRGSTAVVPYSLRARAVSSVALPIEWSELDKLKDPAQFTLEKAMAHVKKRKKDPWQGMHLLQQKIEIL